MPITGDFADKIIPGANTIDLPASRSRGVLLFHGFGDTPQTFELLATDLHAAGFGVRAPLLPGHGRSIEEFIVSRRSQWLEFARAELTEFRKRHAAVSVVGLSMGAALAAVLAAENPDLCALVLIAPYFGMKLNYRAASASHWIWGPIAGTVKSNSPGSIKDPVEREKNLGYGVYTGRLLYELWRLARRARLSLPRIQTPTLLIQSREDPRVASSIAERAFVSLGAEDKRLMWTDGAGHIITVDYGRERVFKEVRAWLEAHM
jgi:carboxylesterase